jgi:hypothetical protein
LVIPNSQLKAWTRFVNDGVSVAKLSSEFKEKSLFRIFIAHEEPEGFPVV